VNGKILAAAATTVAIAGIAVGFGLGGAYASGKGGTPKLQKGTIWAVVNSDGTLARHSKDITGVVRVTTGQYRVFARGDVRNCAYMATGGSVGLAAPPRTYADVAQGSSTPEAPSSRHTTRQARAPAWTATSTSRFSADGSRAQREDGER
jgi:hypothetical protein